MGEFAFEMIFLTPNSISLFFFFVSGVYMFVLFSVKGQNVFGMRSKLFNSTTVAGKQPQKWEEDGWGHRCPPCPFLPSGQQK